MNLTQAINYRRSVRKFDPDKEIDTQKVKKCIEQATLAPNSSNMQLWEFYRVKSKQAVEEATPIFLPEMALRPECSVQVCATCTLCGNPSGSAIW